MNLRNFLYILISISLFSSAFSQEKKGGVISGVIKDARSKTPLNEAVITLTSNTFEGQKFALTDSTGKYRISNLPAGNYTISFEMEGYEKFTQENIILRDGMSLGVSFEMARERREKTGSKKTAR